MIDISTRAGAEAAAHRTLMADLNATLAQLHGSGVAITVGKELSDRRRYQYLANQLNVVSTGSGVVIATSESRVSQIEEIVRERTRDEIFSLAMAVQFSEFLRTDGQYLEGPALANICSRDRFRHAAIPLGVVVELFEGKDVESLYDFAGFDHALNYGERPSRPDVLAVTARRNGVLIGIAAASADATEMWQIGIDIVPAERRSGIGRAIVSRLTEAIFDAGIVPYYASSLPNIGSRNLAHTLGFWPAWVEICAKDVVAEG